MCTICKVSKLLIDFYKKSNGIIVSECKKCSNARGKLYRDKHKNEASEYRKNYYLLHKEELINYGRQYRSIEENKKHISENKKEYLIKNRVIIREQSNKRRKIKRDTDPFYRLRNLVSRTIAKMLKKNGSSKKGGSIKNALPYTIKELRNHLQKQFEPWMNWNNQGKYLISEWNDNDQSTWKWQIDHIIPHSTLPYTSMEDDNFKKCWALDNLRPLSAKQNCLDGYLKTRHRK